MSQNDHTPDQSGTGAGGSSSSGSRGEPEYGQRVEGAPSGPTHEAPRYGQDGGQQGYPPPSYGQDQAPQYGQYDQYGQGGQDTYGRPENGYPGQYGQGRQDTYGQPENGYPGQYGQGRQDTYGQAENGYPGQYGQGYQGGYGTQGYPAQYPGHYDAGSYGGGAKPAGTGLGIASLVLGILALLTCWMLGLGIIPGLVGLVLGIVAIRKLGRVRGASRAVPIVGVVLSALGIVAGIFFFVAVISLVGPILDRCGEFAGDPVALEQCVNQQMGVGAFPQ
jgi:hypothetical protein